MLPYLSVQCLAHCDLSDKFLLSYSLKHPGTLGYELCA